MSNLLELAGGANTDMGRAEHPDYRRTADQHLLHGGADVLLSHGHGGGECVSTLAQIIIIHFKRSTKFVRGDEPRLSFLPWRWRSGNCAIRRYVATGRATPHATHGTRSGVSPGAAVCNSACISTPQRLVF